MPEKKTATAKPVMDPVEIAGQPTEVDETPPLEAYVEPVAEPLRCANTRCNNGNPWLLTDNIWVKLRGGRLFCSEFCAQYGVLAEDA